MVVFLTVILVIVVLAVMGATISANLHRPQPRGVELVDIDYAYWDTTSKLVDQPIYVEGANHSWEQHYGVNLLDADQNFPKQWDDAL